MAGRDRQSSDGRLDACAAFSDHLGSPLGTSPLWPEVRDCREADNCTNCGKRSALLKSCARERAGFWYNLPLNTSQWRPNDETPRPRGPDACRRRRTRRARRRNGRPHGGKELPLLRRRRRAPPLRARARRPGTSRRALGRAPEARRLHRPLRRRRGRAGRRLLAHRLRRTSERLALRRPSRDRGHQRPRRRRGRRRAPPRGPADARPRRRPGRGPPRGEVGDASRPNRRRARTHRARLGRSLNADRRGRAVPDDDVESGAALQRLRTDQPGGVAGHLLPPALPLRLRRDGLRADARLLAVARAHGRCLHLRPRRLQYQRRGKDLPRPLRRPRAVRLGAAARRLCGRVALPRLGPARAGERVAPFHARAARHALGRPLEDVLRGRRLGREHAEHGQREPVVRADERGRAHGARRRGVLRPHPRRPPARHPRRRDRAGASGRRARLGRRRGRDALRLPELRLGRLQRRLLQRLRDGHGDDGKGLHRLRAARPHADPDGAARRAARRLRRPRRARVARAAAPRRCVHGLRRPRPPAPRHARRRRGGLLVARDGHRRAVRHLRRADVVPGCDGALPSREAACVGHVRPHGGEDAHRALHPLLPRARGSRPRPLRARAGALRRRRVGGP